MTDHSSSFIGAGGVPADISSDEDAQQGVGPPRSVDEDQRWSDIEAMGFSVPSDVGLHMSLRG